MGYEWKLDESGTSFHLSFDEARAIISKYARRDVALVEDEKPSSRPIIVPFVSGIVICVLVFVIFYSFIEVKTLQRQTREGYVNDVRMEFFGCSFQLESSPIERVSQFERLQSMGLKYDAENNRLLAQDGSVIAEGYYPLR